MGQVGGKVWGEGGGGWSGYPEGECLGRRRTSHAKREVGGTGSATDEVGGVVGQRGHKRSHTEVVSILWRSKSLSTFYKDPKIAELALCLLPLQLKTFSRVLTLPVPAR